MYSPSISIFGAALNRSCRPVSSTGFAVALVSSARGAAHLRVPKSGLASELPCLPMGCGSGRRCAETSGLACLARERKESIKFSGLARRNSNRKERQFSARAPLLNWANTSGIRLFADPQRQSSAWADDMVMDRGAEGAARGCDAV